MKEMHGWHGKGLDIDLTTGTIQEITPKKELYMRYLGGRGLGVRMVFDQTGPDTDPLGPENIIVFAAGPFTGSNIPTSGRFSAVSRSPLTGTMFDCNCGGRFGVQMKFNGWDFIVVRGKSPKPVFIALDKGKVSIEDAGELWGLNVRDVTARLGDRGSVLTIGRAGERGVLLSGVVNDIDHSLARGGFGAIMGSKNLKALVARGHLGRLEPVHPRLYEKYYQDITRLLTMSPVSSKGLTVYGTSVLMNLINYMKILPTDNFRKTTFSRAEEISGEKMHGVYNVKSKACYSCPIVCRKEEKETTIPLPEYETLAMFGSNLNNIDLKSIVEANELCNEYGLDTISVGTTLSCHAEIEGRDLTPEEIVELVKQIGENEGVGRELGQGSHRYALTRDAAQTAMEVKGLELPGYDPRGVLGQALGYATSNRGGCHLRAYLVGLEILGKPKLINRLSFDGKSGLVALFQNIAATVDSLIVCKFSKFSVSEEEYANILSALTGLDFPSQSLIDIGERIWNLERLYNLNAGIGTESDTLPERFFTEDGSGSAKKIDHDAFMRSLQEYYHFRGWDEKGVPSTEQLKGMGLEPDGRDLHVA